MSSGHNNMMVKLFETRYLVHDFRIIFSMDVTLMEYLSGALTDIIRLFTDDDFQRIMFEVAKITS
jgi:hypothetical protein